LTGLFILIKDEVPKRLSGQTKMFNVHTTVYDKRVVISMNQWFQPISDDDKVISELSNFLVL